MCKTHLTWISFAVATAATSASSSVVLDEAFFRLIEAEQRSVHHPSSDATEIMRVYEATFGTVTEDRMKSISNADLRRSFMAAKIALIHTHCNRFVEIMKHTRNEMVRRRMVHSNEDRHTQSALVLLRRFEEARRFVAVNDDFRHLSIPNIRSVTAPPDQWHRVMAEGQSGLIDVMPLKLAKGFHVIAVAHPDCTPSKRAMQDILADGNLSSSLAAHMTWLIPPELEMDLTKPLAWLRQSAPQRGFLVYARTDWPGIDMTETPAFFVIVDGSVVDVVRGWPRHNGKRRLLDALASAGALKAWHDSHSDADRN